MIRTTWLCEISEYKSYIRQATVELLGVTRIFSMTEILLALSLASSPLRMSAPRSHPSSRTLNDRLITCSAFVNISTIENEWTSLESFLGDKV